MGIINGATVNWIVGIKTKVSLSNLRRLITSLAIKAEVKIEQ